MFGSKQTSCHNNESKETSGKTLHFTENNMVIQNIDVESIEPVDSHMRDSLMQSVQLTIEMSTTSIELTAQHDATKMEQSARGRNCNDKGGREAGQLVLILFGPAFLCCLLRSACLSLLGPSFLDL